MWNYLSILPANITWKYVKTIMLLSERWGCRGISAINKLASRRCAIPIRFPLFQGTRTVPSFNFHESVQTFNSGVDFVMTVVSSIFLKIINFYDVSETLIKMLVQNYVAEHWELQGASISCLYDCWRLSFFHLTANDLRNSDWIFAELDAFKQEFPRRCVDEKWICRPKNVVKLVVDNWQKDWCVSLHRLKNGLLDGEINLIIWRRGK